VREKRVEKLPLTKKNTASGISGGSIMARPVKETPILTGIDAKRFEEATKANEKKTITSQEQKRIMDAWRTFEVVNKKRV
jgi:hypothetical protein